MIEYGQNIKASTIIPANYFCHYHINLNDKEEWALYIYRYYSMHYSEEIEISVKSGITRIYNDNYLRDRSYMYGG